MEQHLIAALEQIAAAERQTDNPLERVAQALERIAAAMERQAATCVSAVEPAALSKEDACPNSHPSG